MDLVQLDTASLKWSADKATCRFLLKKPTKTYSIYTSRRHACNLQVLMLTSLPVDEENPRDKKLCPVRCLKFYLKCTNALRLRHLNTKLFICTCEPFGPATLQTVSHWVKEIMIKAGVNVKSVTKLNFRSASSSRAYSMGISLSRIMNRAGWSRGSTFTRHYLRNIERRHPSKLLNEQRPMSSHRSRIISGLTVPQAAVDADPGRKVRKFAKLWSGERSPLYSNRRSRSTSTSVASEADMSEQQEALVNFISDGSFLSTSPVHMNESDYLD